MRGVVATPTAAGEGGDVAMDQVPLRRLPRDDNAVPVADGYPQNEGEQR